MNNISIKCYKNNLIIKLTNCNYYYYYQIESNNDSNDVIIKKYIIRIK